MIRLLKSNSTNRKAKSRKSNRSINKVPRPGNELRNPRPIWNNQNARARYPMTKKPIRKESRRERHSFFFVLAEFFEPDVAEVFTDSESVNQALRGLLSIIQRQAEKVHQ